MSDLINRRSFLTTSISALASAFIPALPVGKGDVLANPHQQAAAGILTPIFDEQFKPRLDRDGSWVAKTIYQDIFHRTLDEAIQDNLILVPDFVDILLPIGYNQNQRSVDFARGMSWMWKAKYDRISQSSNLRTARRIADRFMDKMKDRNTTNLSEYKTVLDRYGIEELIKFHQSRKKRFNRPYSATSWQIIDYVVSYLNSEMLMAISLYEIIPTFYYGQPYNPVFKVWLFNRYLREGGVEFIEGFPSRWDGLISHGPFQLTSGPVGDVSKQIRDITNNAESFPGTIEGLTNIGMHFKTAAIYSRINWERLVTELRLKNVRTVFFNTIKALDQNSRSIFIAGTTACMHNNRSVTMKYLVQFLKSRNTNNIHYRFPVLLRQKGNKGEALAKYYRYSVEAFLFLRSLNLDK